MFLDQFLFELSGKNMETHSHTEAQTDSDEYTIVAFYKNATTINSIKKG